MGLFLLLFEGVRSESGIGFRIGGLGPLPDRQAVREPLLADALLLLKEVDRFIYTQFVFIRIRYKNIEAQIREKLRIC